MSDPLGLIGSGGGSAGLGPAREIGAGVRTGVTEAGGSGEGSFREALLKSLKRVDELQKEATTAVEDLQTGKRQDLEGVLLATEKADTAFRLLLAVRNKVAAAYEEVKQMRV